MLDLYSPLRRSCLAFTAFLLVTTAMPISVYAAFNPNEGAESQPSVSKLPSVEPLLGNSRYPRHAMPLPDAHANVSIAPTSLPPLMPVSSVSFPKIDSSTLQSTFIAPPPLLAPVAPQVVVPDVTTTVPVATSAPLSPPVAQTVVVAAPVPTATAVIATPPLSRETKDILSHIPSKLDVVTQGKTGKLSVNRATPELADLQVKDKVDAYESNGIKISVRRSGLDTNYELNRAYNALSGGDTEAAIGMYKNVLSAEPKNQEALFGLASLYHRQGQLENARSFYRILLKNYPNHRDGLNNFLALVSEESPQEALAELERLEQRNSRFSPIPAQQAMVLDKLGYATEARSKMLRAIELSPDNLTYKYNLAVMSDKQGNYDEAADLYRLLIQAEGRGETIPASVDVLQKRLNYIATAVVAARPAG